MHFKLLIALICEEKSDQIMEAARQAGATGATIISHARGEGIQPQKTFFGLSLESHRDMLLFLVEEHLSRSVLETIAKVGGFSEESGAGIAFQLDVDDVVGISKQMDILTPIVENEL